MAGQETVSQGACSVDLSQQGDWVGPHACSRPSISFPRPSFVVFISFLLLLSQPRNSLDLYRFWSELSTFLLQPPLPIVLPSFVTVFPSLAGFLVLQYNVLWHCHKLDHAVQSACPTRLPQTLLIDQSPRFELSLVSVYPHTHTLFGSCSSLSGFDLWHKSLQTSHWCYFICTMRTYFDGVLVSVQFLSVTRLVT